jgi:hypothetical protein
MKIYTLFFCAVFFMLAHTASAQKNLVSNGGFEDALSEWSADNSAKVTPWDYRGGKNACAIIVYNGNNWVGLSQTVRIPKNTLGMEFSGWLKTINVVKGDDEWKGAIFSIEFLDKADKKIGDGENITRLSGDHDWEQAKKQVKIPATAVSFRVLLAMGYASGTMLIDDITAKVLNAEEVAKL